jgi:chromate transporter
MSIQTKNLTEVASVFLKLGCFAFGGPAAHVAMMEQEIVHKRKWMDHDHFLDLLGTTNLIPGPNSTEMTMHCGRERAGILGLFVAGFCFIFPAVLITALLGWVYVEYGSIPQIESVFQGITPAVIAIILIASIKLAQKANKNNELAIIGLLAATAYLLGINEVQILFGFGIIGAIYFYLKEKRKATFSISPFFLLGITPLKIVPFIPALKLFWIFLKIGSILYGGGYVLFAYLDSELVATNMLSRQQLIDAIAIGQFTPGPVLSTATFIGYQLSGIKGAFTATAGIFLPSFLFVLLLNPIIPKLRKSLFFSHFLNVVNITSVALLLGVLIDMGQSVLINWKNVVIFLFFLALLLKFKKMNSMWIVLGGATIGYLFSFI